VNQDEELSKTGLRWSEGYHAASIGRRQLPIVIAYIKNQARRHPEKMVAASAVVAG
jgi:hypothetical protein